MACCTVATAANRAARRSSSATNSVVNELHCHRVGYDAGLDTLVEKKSNCRASTLAVVEGPVVDVHPDECVSLVAVESARKAHGVVERVFPVIEPVGNALAEMTRHLFLHVARH